MKEGQVSQARLTYCAIQRAAAIDSREGRTTLVANMEELKRVSASKLFNNVVLLDAYSIFALTGAASGTNEMKTRLRSPADTAVVALGASSLSGDSRRNLSVLP